MNSFGKNFGLHIFGASHESVIGCIVYGVKAGIKLVESDFKEALERRKPHKLGTTARIEEDEVKILTGVFNGYTTGSDILLIFENKNIKSKDYSQFRDIPRPSHADFVANYKYHGFNDLRGGGTFSGRTTLALVCAGVIADKIYKFEVDSKITLLNGSKNELEYENIIKNAINNNDSVGGVIRLEVKNPLIGLGEPYFNSVESTIASLLFSVPGIKGVSFGSGFEGVNLLGSEFNDSIIDKDGKTLTNNAGGINGGITNGNLIVINCAVRPTASISKKQSTYSFKENKMVDLEIKGRHDAAIINRVGVVLESCVKIALVDLYLEMKRY